MRLDQFLKISRLVKRRPLAKEICEMGAVKINGHVAKAGHEINIGDVLEISFWNRDIRLEILEVPHTAIPKGKAGELYKILEQIFKEGEL